MNVRLEAESLRTQVIVDDVPVHGWIESPLTEGWFNQTQKVLSAVLGVTPVRTRNVDGVVYEWDTDW